MILTMWANQARVEQAREEARLRGRAEENRRWQEYLDRRAVAERAGLPFTEPRPELPEPFHDDR